MAQPSLAARAAIAVLLMIGFYVLAIAIAGALLGIVYLDFASGHIQPKLIIICIAGAGMILWSILPRRDKFVSPGPTLDPGAHPKLFQEIRSLASGTGQQMPSEVYLVHDMNAWVAQRGGTVGFGSRRVMGLGLPLLQSLNISQFRAVLAHEFGHYYGGDTALGPFIYKTRNAMRRTIRNLAEANSVLAHVFLWYGNLFLKVTQAISRRQELAADDLAARVVGPQHLASGLTVVHAAAGATQTFWNEEIAPVLQAGFRPSVVDGFSRFMSAESVRKIMDATSQAELKSRKADRFDSHPPLAERLESAKRISLPGELPRTEPAVSLLNSPERVEADLLNFLLGAEKMKKLKPIAWEEVPNTVFGPAWQEAVARNRGFLKGITPHALPERTKQYAPLFRGEPVFYAQQWSEELRAIGAALILAAVQQGATLHAMPGEMFVEKAGSSFQPFSVAPNLALKKMAHADWQETCRKMGISEVDLGTVGQAAAVTANS